MSRFADMQPCDGCGKDFCCDVLTEVEVLTAKATMWSPAEYDYRYLCPSCCEADDRDPAYEVANAIWRETHGGEL